jgi:hypothetical protein
MSFYRLKFSILNKYVKKKMPSSLNPRFDRKRGIMVKPVSLHKDYQGAFRKMGRCSEEQNRGKEGILELGQYIGFH